MTCPRDIGGMPIALGSRLRHVSSTETVVEVLRISSDGRCIAVRHADGSIELLEGDGKAECWRVEPPPDKPLPFTKEPGVQSDIRRQFRELLDHAERGEFEGIFVAVSHKDGCVSSYCIGEKRFTLWGAVLDGLLQRMRDGA